MERRDRDRDRDRDRIFIIFFFSIGALILFIYLLRRRRAQENNINIYRVGPTGATGGGNNITTTGPTGPGGRNFSSMGPTGFPGPTGVSFLSIGSTGFSNNTTGPTGALIGPPRGISDNSSANATFFNADGYSEVVPVEELTYGSATLLLFNSIVLNRPGTTGPSPIHMKITDNPSARYDGTVSYLFNLQGVRYSPYEYFTVTSDGQNPYFNLALGSRGLTWGDAGDSMRIYMSILLGKS